MTRTTAGMRIAIVLALWSTTMLLTLRLLGVSFRPIFGGGIASLVDAVPVGVVLLMTVLSFIAFTWSVRFCSRSIGAGQIAPDRVRSDLEQNRAELQSTLEALEASNQKLEYLATQDSMTGCLNRRAFLQKFGEHWKAADRYDVPLSCIMVDIDQFKSVNDTHGHATGDEVLVEVAKKLRTTVRETDFVCRYGGDEFCVLLPHVDASGAGHAAERIRAAIAEITTSPITASLGVSDRSFAAETPEAMLEQADQCLYIAKRNGRNQVVTYQCDEVEPQRHGDAEEVG